jgi:hypothetical protein
MKKYLLSLLVLPAILFCFGCAGKPDNEITEEIKKSLRQDASDFMQSLKTVLVKEMQTNGIVAAVSVCSDTAQALTINYGENKDIYIKRVSFKNRNSGNLPDDFESKGLKQFEELKQAGNLNESSEIFEVFENEGTKSIRYLKPIVIQAPCLGCHGETENISPDVKAVLNSKYPEDKATGYRLNDLRGAVSVRKTLK